MKPAPFEYEAPTSVDEAVALLAEHGQDAKVLAGGQSLAPLLNFRLARPQTIIDINRLDELSYIDERDGAVAIGALTRQRHIELSSLVGERLPLLRAATAMIAHPPIRNRGTIGGSLAHNDPAAEYPAALLALGARVQVQSTQGTRWLPVDELLGEWLSTTLEPADLITAVEVPLRRGRTAHGFVELSKRPGDFAVSGVAVVLDLEEAGRIAEAAVVAFAGLPRATRLGDVETGLRGATPSDELFAEAGRVASSVVDPVSDIHATQEYRKHLFGVLTTRALRQATTEGRE